MATDKPLTFSNFLKSQVLRADYVVIDEPTPDRTRFPHEKKLEILHALCIHRGYREAQDCERVRRALYTQEHEDGRPPQLLLALAYLPDQVISLPEHVDSSSENKAIAKLRLASSFSPARTHYRHSSLNWEQRRYCLYLPDDIHSLLIERDCALLAA